MKKLYTLLFILSTIAPRIAYCKTLLHCEGQARGSVSESLSRDVSVKATKFIFDIDPTKGMSEAWLHYNYCKHVSRSVTSRGLACLVVLQNGDTIDFDIEYGDSQKKIPLGGSILVGNVFSSQSKFALGDQAISINLNVPGRGLRSFSITCQP